MNQLLKKYPEITTLSYTVGIPSEDDNNSWAQMQTSGTNYVSFIIKLSNVKERKETSLKYQKVFVKNYPYPELYKYNVVAGGNKKGMISGSNS